MRKTKTVSGDKMETVGSEMTKNRSQNWPGIVKGGGKSNLTDTLEKKVGIELKSSVGINGRKGGKIGRRSGGKSRLGFD